MTGVMLPRGVVTPITPALHPHCHPYPPQHSALQPRHLLLQQQQQQQQHQQQQQQQQQHQIQGLAANLGMLPPPAHAVPLPPTFSANFTNTLAMERLRGAAYPHLPTQYPHPMSAPQSVRLPLPSLVPLTPRSQSVTPRSQPLTSMAGQDTPPKRFIPAHGSVPTGPHKSPHTHHGHVTAGQHAQLTHGQRAGPLTPGQRGQMTPGTLTSAQGVVFSQEEVDMALYGYARSREKQGPGHALSGLRVGQLSHGIERILGGQPEKPDPPVSPEPTDLVLPEGLTLRRTSFSGVPHYGVFCTRTLLPKGSRFGPFQGKVVNTSEIKTNDDNTYMWEIFQEGRLSHFVDGRGGAGNWMAFVNNARYAEEQNLLAIQMDGKIYYESCKDIARGTELLVWYGDSYLQFLGIPVALKDSSTQPIQIEVENSEGYDCERCGKVFAYKYYRDKHLKYTRCVDQGDRKFPCHLCTRSFEKRDRLRIHILHVHERHRPHKCNVCSKSFSQSSSLNKHMRVHSGERPYKCVYCSKAFTASSILRTHIRQHSGEKPFKCKHCGKAFASHAAHDSHVRRTHPREKAEQDASKLYAQTHGTSLQMRLKNA